MIILGNEGLIWEEKFIDRAYNLDIELANDLQLKKATPLLQGSLFC